MAWKRFFMLDLDKKPTDVYEFAVKVFQNKSLTEENLKPTEPGISKVNGEIVFE